MTDRELLELAAKAVCLPDARWDGFYPAIVYMAENGIKDCPWDPLTSDAEAFRLAVKLGIEVTPFLSGACAVTTPDGWKRTESGYESGYAATRRAIVRAAAEIGRRLP